MKEFNYLENDKRSRIFLINAPPNIEISNKTYLYSYIPFNFSKSNSIQIAFFDSDGQNYSAKVISIDEINNEFNIVKYLRKKESILSQFNEELIKFVEKKQENVEIIKTLIAKTELKRIKINFFYKKRYSQ